MAITRRQFITIGTTLAASAAVGYSLIETHEPVLRAITIPLARLPTGFEGFRIALIADVHHGPYFSLKYVEEIVNQTNDAKPDLILLGGDYPYYKPYYIPPVMSVLAKLRAPFGVYAVRGNHDNLAGAEMCSDQFRRNGIKEITNTGFWLDRNGSRLFLCGVDDFCTGRPDLTRALKGLQPDDPALLLTHNPDFFECVRSSNVIFGMAGHTHGGQVNLPLIGSPVIPSIYGQKYAYGLVQAPDFPVYVTSGIGTIFPPIRFGCPPEISLITLTQKA